MRDFAAKQISDSYLASENIKRETSDRIGLGGAVLAVALLVIFQRVQHRTLVT